MQLIGLIIISIMIGTLSGNSAYGWLTFGLGLFFLGANP